MSLMSPCQSCAHRNFGTGTFAVCDPESCPALERLTLEVKTRGDELALFRAAINALMAERRALRSFAAALGIRSQVPLSRRLELSQEHLRLEGIARRACKTAGFELRNNDQPQEAI